MQLARRFFWKPAPDPSEAWTSLETAPEPPSEMPPELRRALVPDAAPPEPSAPPCTPVESESSFEADFGECERTDDCPEARSVELERYPWREEAEWRRRAEAELAGAASLLDLAIALWRLRGASPELSWKKFYARCGRLGVCLATFERHVDLAAQLRARPELRVPAAELRTEDLRIVRRAFAVRLGRQ